MKLPWKFLRRAIQVRDGFKCRKCKAKKHLTVHHIRPRDEGVPDEPRNLITLCSPCHDWAEVQTSEGHLGWVDLLKPLEGEAIKRVWWQDSQGRINALVFEEDENPSEIEIANLIKPIRPVLPIRPSEVTDWNRCPRYWHYKHVDGWSPPPSAWSPERLMGTAIHEGLAAYWQRHKSGPEYWTKQVFIDEWPPDAPPEFSREGLESQALKVLDAVIKWIAKTMPDAQPVMVEQALGADGHTTPDLVTREEGDILAVTDWKVSMNLPADRIQYRLQDIEKTHQFLHYCWAVGEHLKEPVRLFRKVVIAAGPSILVRDATFTPNDAMLAAWLRDARMKWDLMNQMRQGIVYPWRQEDGCLKYGAKWRGQYWDACWTCHGDEEKMAQFLVRRDGRDG